MELLILCLSEGFETAKALSLHGCHVVMGCRDMNLGRKAAEKIRKAQVRFDL